DDGVWDFAMRLTMDSLGGFGVRRMDEAERGAITLVKPIGHVFYAVSVLNIDVPAVRLSDVLSLQTTQVVAVHKNRHAIPFGCHSGWSPCEAIAIFAGCALACASRLMLMGLLATALFAGTSACKDAASARALGESGARHRTTG